MDSTNNPQNSGAEDNAVPATPTLPAGENAYNRQKCDKAKHRLYVDTASLLASENIEGGRQTTTWALSTVLNHWIMTEYKNYVRANHAEDMALWDDCIVRIVDLMAFLDRARSTTELIDYYEKQVAQSTPD